MIQSVDGPYQDTVDDSVDMQDWPQDDARLVGIIQSNPSSNEAHQAFQLLVQRYTPEVFAIIYRSLRNRADAEDITQEVFLRAFRKLSQLKDPSLFVGWLKRIAQRLSINHAVRDHKDFQMDDACDVGFLDAQPGSANEAPVLLQQREHIELIRKVLPQLSPNHQKIIQRFYFDGWSLIKIAEELSKPVGTIKSGLYNARVRIGNMICDIIPDFDLSIE